MNSPAEYHPRNGDFLQHFEKSRSLPEFVAFHPVGMARAAVRAITNVGTLPSGETHAQ